MALCDLAAALNPAAHGRGGWQCTGSIPSTLICSGSSSSWGGVICSSGIVSTITLISLKLTGTIPTSIGLLSRLSSLYVYLNSITGSIPSTMGLLSKINTLRLDGNSLTGSVPSTLCADSALTMLYVSSNRLSCYALCMSSVTISAYDTLPMCSNCKYSVVVFIVWHYYFTHSCTLSHCLLNNQV